MGERTLVDGGRADEVIRVRSEYQEMMRDDLVELVEGATERKVIAYVSGNHIDPDVAIEVFAYAATGAQTGE